jgi:hypothetical protein
MLRSLQNTPFDMSDSSLRENRSDLGPICDDRGEREAAVQAGEKLRRQRNPRHCSKETFRPPRYRLRVDPLPRPAPNLLRGFSAPSDLIKYSKSFQFRASHKSTPDAFGAV